MKAKVLCSNKKKLITMLRYVRQQVKRYNGSITRIDRKGFEIEYILPEVAEPKGSLD